MKKLIALIAIIALVSGVVFAAGPTVLTNATTSGTTTTYASTLSGTSDVVVKTVVAPKASATWFKTQQANLETGATYADLISDITDNEMFVFDADSDPAVLSWDVYPTILTNFKKQITATITATPLSTVTSGYTAANCIEYTIAVDSSVPSEDKTATAVTYQTTSATTYGTFSTSGTGLRIKNDVKVTFATTANALHAAEEGTYRSTVTMTISTEA